VIDKSDAFVFGYSKLDVTFGRTTLDAVRLPYSTMAKSGVRTAGGDHRERSGAPG
jgi:sulfide:quinone oxidoreductase